MGRARKERTAGIQGGKGARKEGKPRIQGGGRPGKERTAGMGGGDLGKKGSLG
jgi:hypothetical protein